MATAKKRLGKGAIAAIVALSTLVVLVVVGLLLVPSLVARKVAEAGDKRGLVIKYGGYALGFGSVGLSQVEVTPKSNKAFRLTASEVVAEISWFSPKAVRIPTATLELDGSPAKLQATLEAIRAADAKLPRGERLPLTIEAGKITWKNFVGPLGKITFESVKVQTTPAEEKVEVDLDKGLVSFLIVTVEPVSGKLVRKGKALDAKVRLAPKDAGTAELVLHHEDGDEATLTVKGLRPSAFLDFDIPGGVKVKKATLDADVTASRDADGAIAASGSLTAAKLELPKVPVGPLSLGLGTTLGLTFKVTPDKKPGDVKIEKAALTFTLGGKPRTVKVTGKASLGETLEGPFHVDLAYDFGPVPCSDLAGELVGGAVGGGLGGLLAGGLASKAVSGNLTVNGTIKGDPTRPDKLVRTTNVTEGCKVEAGKALGGLLE